MLCYVISLHDYNQRKEVIRYLQHAKLYRQLKKSLANAEGVYQWQFAIYLKQRREYLPAGITLKTINSIEEILQSKIKVRLASKRYPLESPAS